MRIMVRAFENAFRHLENIEHLNEARKTFPLLDVLSSHVFLFFFLFGSNIRAWKQMSWNRIVKERILNFFLLLNPFDI